MIFYGVKSTFGMVECAYYNVWGIDGEYFFFLARCDIMLYFSKETINEFMYNNFNINLFSCIGQVYMIMNHGLYRII